MGITSNVPRLLLGSCPDSWGVSFANDPLQTPWSRFLDEIASVGYEWIELGPYGYLPTDPHQLGDELNNRGLKVAGGTMHGHSGLHRPADFAKSPRGDAQSGGADGGGGCQARDLRAGARISR